MEERKEKRRRKGGKEGRRGGKRESEGRKKKGRGRGSELEEKGRRRGGEREPELVGAGGRKGECKHMPFCSSIQSVSQTKYKKLLTGISLGELDRDQEKYNSHILLAL